MVGVIDYSAAATAAPTAEGNRIGGRHTSAERTTDVTDPATGKVLATVPLSGAAEVEAAVDAALAAGESWARTNPFERARILNRWAELLLARQADIAATATAEMGKPLAESLGEVGRAAAEITFMAGEAPRTTGEQIPSSVAGTLVVTLRAPVGLVLAITPWNFPVVSPVRKIAPALAYGNTVICKPSMEAPLTALALADLAAEAGLPDGVLNVVIGDRAGAGSALVGHPAVRAISFTGSTTAGRAIAEVAGRNLVPVQLELGGKNAVYVDASADLDLAVPEIVAGRDAGCRPALHLDQPRARRRTDRRGADATAGGGTRRVDRRGRDRPGGQGGTARVGCRRGTRAGVRADRASPRARASRQRGPRFRLATTFAPTVLDRVTPGMRVAREEIFGPVLSVLQRPWRRRGSPGHERLRLRPRERGLRA